MQDKIINRLEALLLVLQYDSEQKEVKGREILTQIERICINQERGALFEVYDFELGLRTNYRAYKVPIGIEDKIQLIMQVITSSKWEGYQRREFIS